MQNGWATQTRLNSAKAALDGAQATLDVARAELRKMQMRAPFRGRFERNADIGQFARSRVFLRNRGAARSIVFVAQAGENRPARSSLMATLASGSLTEVGGKVSYLARVADPATRQFRVEISVADRKGGDPGRPHGRNQDRDRAGLRPQGQPSLLVPDDQDRLCVRYVDVGGVVSFVPAEIIDETSEGTWVAGLPRNALLVAEGQENVRPGLRVTPDVREEAPAVPARAPKP